MPPGSEDRARAFYVEALGFEEEPKAPEFADRGGVWLRSGAVKLHVGSDPAFVATNKPHAALCCTDFEALLARLEARGIAVARDPTPYEGRAHAYVRDPFGNRLELLDRPA